eukprot:1161779-Pelagomonas_calceolata.AAC.2
MLLCAQLQIRLLIEQALEEAHRAADRSLLQKATRVSPTNRCGYINPWPFLWPANYHDGTTLETQTSTGAQSTHQGAQTVIPGRQLHRLQFESAPIIV